MGKFVVKPAKDGMTFNLLANNGQVICRASQVYASEATCMNGVESVRKNCRSKVEDQTLTDFAKLKNPKYEIFMDKNGEKYYFRLKAMNGEIIAASQGYVSKDSCKNGIESVGKNAPDAEVVKEKE